MVSEPCRKAAPESRSFTSASIRADSARPGLDADSRSCPPSPLTSNLPAYPMNTFLETARFSRPYLARYWPRFVLGIVLGILFGVSNGLFLGSIYTRRSIASTIPPTVQHDHREGPRSQAAAKGSRRKAPSSTASRPRAPPLKEEFYRPHRSLAALEGPPARLETMPRRLSLHPARRHPARPARLRQQLPPGLERPAHHQRRQERRLPQGQLPLARFLPENHHQRAHHPHRSRRRRPQQLPQAGPFRPGQGTEHHRLLARRHVLHRLEIHPHLPRLHAPLHHPHPHGRQKGQGTRPPAISPPTSARAASPWNRSRTSASPRPTRWRKSTPQAFRKIGPALGLLQHEEHPEPRDAQSHRPDPHRHGHQRRPALRRLDPLPPSTIITAFIVALLPSTRLVQEAQRHRRLLHPAHRRARTPHGPLQAPAHRPRSRTSRRHDAASPAPSNSATSASPTATAPCSTTSASSCRAASGSASPAKAAPAKARSSTSLFRFYDPTAGQHRDRRRPPRNAPHRRPPLPPRARQPGHPPLQRHRRGKHRLRQNRRHPRGSHRRRPRSLRRTTSSRPSRKATTPRSANAASASPAASASASPSPAPSSATRPILVLDEATASLDSQSEAEVQKAIDHLAENRTVICVAHRLSTLRSMDHILVLEKGRIVEQGSFDQLLAQRGLFTAMAARQSIHPPAVLAGG